MAVTALASLLAIAETSKSFLAGSVAISRHVRVCVQDGRASQELGSHNARWDTQVPHSPFVADLCFECHACRIWAEQENLESCLMPHLLSNPETVHDCSFGVQWGASKSCHGHDQ